MPAPQTKTLGEEGGFLTWPMVELGEIAEVKLGKMLDREKHTTGHLLPYLNNVSLRWNEVDTAKLPEMYFDDDELDRFGLKAGDVVVCEGGEPGRSAVWDGRLPDLKFQKAIHRVRFNLPFEPRLLVLYLEAIAGTPEFEMLFTGAGIRHLTRETFARLKIPSPSPAEQKKITDCLTSLDEVIAAQGRKVEALKAHKKGLMQQLFPREGETVPRVRFRAETVNVGLVLYREEPRFLRARIIDNHRRVKRVFGVSGKALATLRLSEQNLLYRINERAEDIATLEDLKAFIATRANDLRLKDTEFEIYHGDTLANAWDMLRETNPAKIPKFDAVVANPPFSYRWEPGEAMSEDVRFKSHGVAPKSAADFAFLLHGFHYLKDEG